LSEKKKGIAIGRTCEVERQNSKLVKLSAEVEHEISRALDIYFSAEVEHEIVRMHSRQDQKWRESVGA